MMGVGDNGQGSGAAAGASQSSTGQGSSAAPAAETPSTATPPSIPTNCPPWLEALLRFQTDAPQTTSRLATDTERAPGVVLPFHRPPDAQRQTKEQRRRWMDDLFGKLEQEEENEVEEEQGSDDEDAGSEDEGREQSGMRLPQRGSEDADDDDELPTSPRSATSENRVVLRQPTPTPPDSPTSSTKPLVPEISSATRPPPPKSALKQNPERPPIAQRASFGSTGIRRGFLNLNPSSPGAIRSNYAAEDLDSAAGGSGGAERQGRPPIKTVASHSGVTANSSANASGASTPSKKTVRIQSPERFRTEPSSFAAAAAAAKAAKDEDERLSALQKALREVKKVNEKNARRDGTDTAEKRHADDVGVEEQAQRIVDLLGPGIVEGHPGAPSKDVLDQLQRAFEEDKRSQNAEAIAEREKLEEEERERERKRRLAEKPAVGQSVIERPAGAARKDAATSDVGKAKQSAFKRGFLSQKPPTFAPVKPPRTGGAAAAASGSGSTPASSTVKGAAVPPTQSLGMSALDRASLGDEGLSKERERAGLPPAVPHARPSKAYAEKMARRQQGLEPAATGAASHQTGEELARPQTVDDEPSEGRVRFAAAPSSAVAPAADSTSEEAQSNEINPSARNEVHGDDDDGDEIEDEVPVIRGEGADSDSDDGGAVPARKANGKQRASVSFDQYRGGKGDSRSDGDDDNDESDGDFDDDDDEDDDGYNTDDLMDLQPDMDYNLEAAFDDTELLQEYAKAKAVLAELGLAPGGSMTGHGIPSVGGNDEEDDDDDEDFENDIVPLDATVEDQEYQGNTVDADSSRRKGKVSRFKADAASRQRAREAAAADEAGHDLAHLLSGARNVGQAQGDGNGAPIDSLTSAAFGMDGLRQPAPGDEGGPQGGPVMIIPQLAPVRFPRNGDLIEGKRRPGPVDLAGESSDEDDERAEMAMRSRLERLQWEREHPEEAQAYRDKRRSERAVREGVAPPRVVVGRRSGGGGGGGGGGGKEATESRTTPATAVVGSGSDEVDVPTPVVETTIASPAAAAAAAPQSPPPPPQPKKVSRFKAARLAGDA